MEMLLFNPFENLNLAPLTCFLTGEDLLSADQQVSVFPDWILDRFSLRDKQFKMLDQVTAIRYPDLRLPCSAKAQTAIDLLEEEIREAFATGYEAVIKLPEERLFQWMGKLLYGVLYNDLCIEISRASRKESPFTLSPYLSERFAKFHLMLQSLVAPVEFRGRKPWSIEIVRLKYSKDIFNYKDEPSNLNFSLGMNGFGIVACLQDNGAVGENQRDITRKMEGKTLHPIQFEELCARFQYANYLLRYKSGYQIRDEGEKVVIESIAHEGSPDRPLFGAWDDNLFARVLADYWKPWGFTKDQIITLPDAPISFLENDFTHQFIEPESITLPY